MTQGEDITTAMAKALVDGLEAEGVENIWSKLNQKNTSDYRTETPMDGMLFYVDPKSFIKKKGTKQRKKDSFNDEQLLLFNDL